MIITNKSIFYLLSIIIISMVSCSPRMNYLGDVYPPTTDVDVFYDEGDIEKDFKVIGQLNADNSNNSFLDLDDVKNKMIEEAKVRGADGIWFLGSESIPDNTHLIYAKLIRYKE